MEKNYLEKTIESAYESELFPGRSGYWGAYDKGGLSEKVFGAMCAGSVLFGAIYFSYEIASNL